MLPKNGQEFEFLKDGGRIIYRSISRVKFINCSALDSTEEETEWSSASGLRTEALAAGRSKAARERVAATGVGLGNIGGGRGVRRGALAAWKRWRLVASAAEVISLVLI